MSFETVNPRIAALRSSATMAFSAKAKELAREGHPVIALSAGEPDFPTPHSISEAGKAAISDGHTTYTSNPGLIELRTAIAAKLKRDNGLEYSPSQILCSNGAKQSVAQSIAVLCSPGEEVIIPAPYWVSYPEMVVLAGGVPVTLPTLAENDYKISPQQLRESITGKSRVLILCSPSNPTGAVYSPQELSDLVDVLKDHPKIAVVSDEIYEYVTYDSEHKSIASFEGMIGRTVTINGFSKAYAMTGWRLGYMAGPDFVIKNASKLQSQFTSAPSNITQRAGLAALKMDKKELQPMIDEFQKRRDYAVDTLNSIEGVHCPKPDGAFYVFPELASYFGKTSSSGRLIKNSEDMCYYLLEEWHVALVPGSAFGAPKGVRLSYAVAMEDIVTALERIQNALADLN